MTPAHSSPDRPLPRRYLAWLLALGLVGTGAELILLDHTEGIWQKIPLAVIGLSLAALGMAAVWPRRSCLRAVQGAMFLLMAAGIVGFGMHFNGNREFELEMHPDQTGWPLVWATLKGATPALAPGMLLLLGALGLAWTYGLTVLNSARQFQYPSAKSSTNQTLDTP